MSSDTDDEAGRDWREVFLNGSDQAVRSHKEKSSKVVLCRQGE